MYELCTLLRALSFLYYVIDGEEAIEKKKKWIGMVFSLTYLSLTLFFWYSVMVLVTFSYNNGYKYISGVPKPCSFIDSRIIR